MGVRRLFLGSKESGKEPFMSVIQTTAIQRDDRDIPPEAAALDQIDRVSQREDCNGTDVQGRFRCQVCGEPARVQVLTGYSSAGPLFMRLCLHCEQHEMIGAYQPTRRRHLRAWLLIAMAGTALLTIGIFGDWLIPQRHAGFGWYQGWGVILGLASCLFGLLLGADLIALAGGMLFCASVSADWFGLTQGQGIGNTQQYMISAGLGRPAIALLFWKRSLRFRELHQTLVERPGTLPQGLAPSP
jgi:hypothetical protein